MNSLSAPPHLSRDGAIAVIDLSTYEWVGDSYTVMARLVASLQEDTEVKVVVIAGTPADSGSTERASYGCEDLKRYRKYEQFKRYVNEFLFRVDKPIVIAVDGAYNRGLTLMLMADFVVAERQVSWISTHIHYGLVSASGPFFWPLLTGLNNARRYLLLGERFSAEEAKDMGIVTEVVDEGKSRASALECARRLAQFDGLALQGTKRAINQWLRIGYGPVLLEGLGTEFLALPDFMSSAEIAPPDVR